MTFKEMDEGLKMTYTALENPMVRPYREPEMALYVCEQCGAELFGSVVEEDGLLYCDFYCYGAAMGAKEIEL